MKSSGKPGEQFGGGPAKIRHWYIKGTKGGRKGWGLTDGKGNPNIRIQKAEKCKNLAGEQVGGIRVLGVCGKGT